MSNETTLSGSDQLDMAPVETAVAILRKTCEKAVDELGGAVPGVQLRALLVFDDAGGSLDLRRLAAELTASVSATSGVCDRMQEAGLLTVGDAASSRAGLCCTLTGSGRRLARWIRDRQRAALSDLVSSMDPQARDALVLRAGGTRHRSPKAVLTTEIPLPGHLAGSAVPATVGNGRRKTQSAPASWILRIMFEGFASGFVDTGDASIFTRYGGDGPAVLLLHGHPRTSATWHWVAPLLVDRGYTVVCPDLRGYGRSRGPAPAADHSAHCKRAVATDMLEVMRELGHDRFSVVGHDRGSCVALRLALDYPREVTTVTLLDGIPITEHLDRITDKFAIHYWHWFFFAQPEVPERVINADPDAWYHGHPAAMGAENYDEWRDAMREPEVVRAMLEDYRAGLTIDRRHQEADRAAGTKLECPTLVLWSEHDDLEELHGDPLAIWANWAHDLTGHPIDSGHHMAEEAPIPLAEALANFLIANDSR